MIFVRNVMHKNAIIFVCIGLLSKLINPLHWALFIVKYHICWMANYCLSVQTRKPMLRNMYLRWFGRTFFHQILVLQCRHKYVVLASLLDLFQKGIPKSCLLQDTTSAPSKQYRNLFQRFTRRTGFLKFADTDTWQAYLSIFSLQI